MVKSQQSNLSASLARVSPEFRNRIIVSICSWLKFFRLLITLVAATSPYSSISLLLFDSFSGIIVEVSQWGLSIRVRLKCNMLLYFLESSPDSSIKKEILK